MKRASFMFVILIVFWSCNKTRTSLTDPGRLPATNVRLVPEKVARAVATNFSADSLYSANKGTNHSPYKSALHGNNSIKNWFVWNDRWGQPAVYIYNFANNSGFLLVSADSALDPVLAFVERGEYQNKTFPAGVSQWVRKTMSNIELVRTGRYTPKTHAGAWELSAGATIGKGNVKVPANSPGGPPPHCIFTYSNSVFTVGPLLPTTWGQECSYNELCGTPGVIYSCNDVNSCSAQPPTGCVATAIAQLVYYWKPVTQYNYNYTSMPLNSGDAEVRRLMRDAGLPENVNMIYTCGESLALETLVPGALINHFGFASASYAPYDSNTVVSDIIYNNYPVLLAGATTDDRHEWVCDGYTTTTYTYTSSCNPGIVYYLGSGNTLIHMNWGWHEISAPNDFNGWFSESNWNIAADNNRNYQYSQTMTTGIHP